MSGLKALEAQFFLGLVYPLDNISNKSSLRFFDRKGFGPEGKSDDQDTLADGD